MRRASITTRDGREVAGRCLLATNAWDRLRGLVGRRALAPGEGLLLRPAASIHTLGLRFAIDAVFCDRELTVIDVVRDLRPGRVAARRGAQVVLELAAGAAEGIEPGDGLVVATIGA